MNFDTGAGKRLLSVEEARHALGLGRTKFYDLIKSGELNTVKVGRLRKVTPEAIDGFVASLQD